jgi:hypothetical protein
LPYSDKYLLYLNNGLDLLFYVFDVIQTCYFYASKSSQVPSLFISYLPNNTDLLNTIKTIASGSLVEINIFVLDNDALLDVEYLEELEYECNQKYNRIKINNVVPDWSKYIDEGSTAVFLNNEDQKKYNTNKKYKHIVWDKNVLEEMKNENQFGFIHYLQKFSIIIPSIHSQNIEEIHNIAKDLKKILKENYGVGYVEVVATHCHLDLDDGWDYDLAQTLFDGLPFGSKRSPASIFSKFATMTPKERVATVFINKIITTDSTGILKLPKDKLEVIDCEEFFN